jgi:hypothetical protein
MLVIWLGALLFIVGVVVLANQAIGRGRLSGQRTSPSAPVETLEPPHRGMRFLGLGSNWPGIVLIVIGGVLLLVGGFF